MSIVKTENYWIADPSLAEVGRQEIVLSEKEMPGLMAVREKYGIRLYDLARKPIAKEYEERLSAENPEYLQGVSLP